MGLSAGLQVWSITVHPKIQKPSSRGPRRSACGAATTAVSAGRSFRTSSSPTASRCRSPAAPCASPSSPGAKDQIFAALEVGGVIRSLDGGEHWDDCADALVDLSARPNLKSKIQSDSEAEGMLDAHALAVSDAAPGAVFLAVRMGLFRSDDRGMKWQDLEVGRFSPLTYGRDIRVSPHDAHVLYAALSPAARSQDGSLYRSADLGKTWTRVDRDVKAQATMMGLALHPRDPDQIYCASRCGQVFGTQDGGRTWQESQLDGIDDVYAIACG